MANTRNDVAIAGGVWTDLYAGSGIAVGTSVIIINKGSTTVFVAAKATAPTSSTFGVPIYAGITGSSVSVTAGESGLWAYTSGPSGVVLVQEA